MGEMLDERLDVPDLKRIMRKNREVSLTPAVDEKILRKIAVLRSV